MSLTSLDFSVEDLERSIPERFNRVLGQLPPGHLAAWTEGGEILSYADLDQRSEHLADAVQAELGGGSQPVGLLLPHNGATLIALLGVIKSGHMCLPLQPDLPEARLVELLNDCPTPLIVTTQALRATAERLAASRPGAPAQVWALEALPAAGPRPGAPVNPQAAAILYYTSGSTDQPRGVICTHNLILYTAYLSATQRELRFSDRAASLSPFGISFSMATIFSTLLCGATACMRPETTPLAARELYYWLVRAQVSYAQLTVDRVEGLADLGETFAPIPRLHSLTTGGKPLPGDLARRMLRLLQPDGVFCCNLGSTEASTLANFILHNGSPHPGDAPWDGGDIPAGYVTPFKEVLILDEQHQPLPPGTRGEIAVRSRFLATGYWNNPELTADRFLPDPQGEAQRLYLTGDLGCMSAEGCVEVLGRKDFQVKLRGYTINLEAVEATLRQLPGVSQAAATLHTQPDGRQMLVGYVVRSGRVGASELRSELARHQPEYMIPAAFVFLEALPMTASGKLNRPALPPPPAQRPDLATPFRAPANPLEARLAEMWAELFGLDRVGVDDNFFDLGGDSLLAGRLFTRLVAEFGVHLPIITLLSASSVHKLVVILQKPPSGDPEPASVVMQTGQPGQPTLFLVYGVGGGVMGYMDLVRRLGPDQPVIALQEIAPPECQLTSIEQKAARAITVLRNLQPDGPYHLAGYCFGGLLAYEMACQLRQAGQAVGLVGMLEVPPAAPGGRRSLVNFLRNLPGWLGENNLRRSILRRLGRLGRHLRQAFFATPVAGEAPDPDSSLDFLARDLETYPLKEVGIMRVNAVAQRAYRPGLYPGRITLFKSRVRAIDWAWLADPLMGWGSLAQSVSVYPVAGFHTSIHLEPYAADLARALRAALAEEEEGAIYSQTPRLDHLTASRTTRIPTSPNA